MENEQRIEVYARQRGLIGPMLDIGVRSKVSYWNVATRITPAQHRRWRKKYHRLSQVPF